MSLAHAKLTLFQGKVSNKNLCDPRICNKRVIMNEQAELISKLRATIVFITTTPKCRVLISLA